jgi:uncharacterized protein (TIGR04255 family)
LNLPSQPRRIYRTNPLQGVIAQLRFPPILDFEAARVAPFQEAVAGTFPYVSEERQVGLLIGPQGMAPPQQTQVLRFKDSEGQRSVVLARDFVAVEANEESYSTFEDFSANARVMLEALGSLAVHATVRSGLRYINRLSHPDATRASDWRRFLNQELLGMVGGELLGDDVLNAVQEIRLRSDDSMTLVMRHGYFGPEAADGNPFYLIDIDCFAERNDEDLSVEHLLEELGAFHSAIHSIFETSINDEMRAHLVVEREEAA